MKKCYACQLEKDLSNFYIRTDNGKKSYRGMCKDCELIKSVLWKKNNKEKSNKTAAQWRTDNSGKVKESHKKWRQNNPNRSKELNKKSRLKNVFGISIEEENRMLLSQNNCCAICNVNIFDYMNEFQKGFCVDHNHETGQIRGLLCSLCNSVIGFSKESIEILDNTKQYLNHYNSIPLEQSNVIPIKRAK